MTGGRPAPIGPYAPAPTRPVLPDPSADDAADLIPLTINERSYLRQILHAWHRDQMPAPVRTLEHKLRG